MKKLNPGDRAVTRTRSALYANTWRKKPICSVSSGCRVTILDDRVGYMVKVRLTATDQVGWMGESALVKPGMRH